MWWAQFWSQMWAHNSNSSQCEVYICTWEEILVLLGFLSQIKARAAVVSFQFHTFASEPAKTSSPILEAVREFTKSQLCSRLVEHKMPYWEHKRKFKASQYWKRRLVSRLEGSEAEQGAITKIGNLFHNSHTRTKNSPFPRDLIVHWDLSITALEITTNWIILT